MDFTTSGGAKREKGNSSLIYFIVRLARDWFIFYQQAHVHEKKG